MQSLRNGILAIATSLLFFGSLATAQMNAPENSTSKSTKSTVSTADRHFMDKAAQGGMAEVELGQLAENNASSQEVKDFGKRMVTDHSKANDELKQLATKQDVTLPTSLDAKDQATKDELSKLHGEAFDKAYMKDMVMDHKKDIAEFKHESTAAHDASLKTWVGDTLPTLESHLQEAEKIAPQVESASMGNSMKKGVTTAEQH